MADEPTEAQVVKLAEWLAAATAPWTQSRATSVPLAYALLTTMPNLLGILADVVGLQEFVDAACEAEVMAPATLIGDPGVQPQDAVPPHTVLYVVNDGGGSDRWARADCRHCERRIVRRVGWGDESWFHADSSTYGCHADQDDPNVAEPPSRQLSQPQVVRMR